MNACTHPRGPALPSMLCAFLRGGEDILGQVDSNLRHAPNSCWEVYVLKSRDARKRSLREAIISRQSEA